MMCGGAQIDLALHMGACKKAPHARKPSVSKTPRAVHSAAPQEQRLSGMSIKELRQAAADASVDVRHCVEKGDMIDAIMASQQRHNAGTRRPSHSAQGHYDNLRAGEAAAAEAAGISEGRMPCAVCGRRFALDR